MLNGSSHIDGTTSTWPLPDMSRRTSSCLFLPRYLHAVAQAESGGDALAMVAVIGALVADDEQTVRATALGQGLEQDQQAFVREDLAGEDERERFGRLSNQPGGTQGSRSTRGRPQCRTWCSAMPTLLLRLSRRMKSLV